MPGEGWNAEPSTFDLPESFVPGVYEPLVFLDIFGLKTGLPILFGIEAIKTPFTRL